MNIQNFPEFHRLDQPDRINNNHGRKSGLRHQGDERGQQKHRHQRHGRGHDFRQLRPGSGQTIDCCLGGTTATGYCAQKCSAGIYQSGSQQLPRFACGESSSLPTKAHPAAIVEGKLIGAMPKAPGESWATSEQDR